MLARIKCHRAGLPSTEIIVIFAEINFGAFDAVLALYLLRASQPVAERRVQPLPPLAAIAMQPLVQLSIDRVRAYMRDHDLSQYQMAKLAGVPWQAVDGILREGEDFIITTNHLTKLERLVMTQPHPVKKRPGRPVTRETKVG